MRNTQRGQNRNDDSVNWTLQVKVTGYSSGRGPRSKRAISRSAQSHLTTATKDGAQTERHFVRIQ